MGFAPKTAERTVTENPVMRTIVQKALGAGLLALSCTIAPSAQAGTFSPQIGEICRLHATEAEKRERMPKLVLSAISLAESGRWHSTAKASFPWPWTVTNGANANYYPDKDFAIAAVRQLQRQGVRNIDVGCMQINLHYHPDAFVDLEEAFDPASNVAYAASFLKSLYGETRSWNRAIGRYHSATPALFERYLHKVTTLWRAERIRVATARREQVKAAYRERQAALRQARARARDG